MNNKHEEMKQEAIEDIMECLEDYSGYYCDLHDAVFNIGNDVICEMMEDIPKFNDNWNNVADDETNRKIIEKIKELATWDY